MEPTSNQAPRASTQGELGLELLGLHLNGAELGKMLGISRQAVSAAVKRGTIRPPGPDGRFNANQAVRDYLNNTDPSRVRVRAMKPSIDLLTELRDQVRTLSEANGALRESLEVERRRAGSREWAATVRAEEDADRRLGELLAMLAERFPEAIQAANAGRLPGWLDELAAVAFYGLDLREYRDDLEPEPDEDTQDGTEDASAQGTPGDGSEADPE